MCVFLFLFLFQRMCCSCLYLFHTCLSNSGIVAAAVVQVSHAAVFGERVHHSGRADCVDK